MHALKSDRCVFKNAVSHDWITNSQGGGSSLSHNCHHSRLIIALSSEVGCCWYCAIHLEFGNSSFSASNSGLDQNSGHNGRPLGSKAGNSITSQPSSFRCAALLRTLPVRSLLDQRVITITIAPPGCRR